MNTMLLAAVLAFAGSSMINIGQAVQKMGLETDPTQPLRRALVWGGGTLSIMLSTFVTLYAISLSSASLVGAMAGTGLASLTLFSIFVMKEKSGLQEILGVAIVLTGAVLMGAFASPVGATIINYSRLYILSAVLLTVYGAMALVLRKKTSVSGLVLGGLGGVFGGLTTLFQRVHTWQIQELEQPFFANPYLYVWVTCAVLSFVVLQFAYKNDKAIRIIPVFSSHFIILPVAGGVLCFAESMAPGQWVGAVLILLGVLAITWPKKNSTEFK